MTKLESASVEESSDRLAEQVGQLNQALELADPDYGAPAIDRWINQAVELVGIVVLATIAFLVFANAVGRYLASSPIVWAEELVIALVPWVAMTGMFLSVRRRQLIRLGYYTLGLPAIVRTTIDILITLLCAATFVVVAYQCFHYVSLFGRDTTTYLRLPTGWFTSVMFAGAAAVALAFLVNAYRDWKDRRAISGARTE